MSSAERRVQLLRGHLVAEGSRQRNKDFVNTVDCSAQSSTEELRRIFKGVEVVPGQVQNEGTMETLRRWHKAVETGLEGKSEEMMEIMDSILAEDVLFLAPTYHKERRDKNFIKFALVGVTKAFKNFKYTRVFAGDSGFALEFSCNIGSADGPFMRGIDLVTVNESGLITKFEVMARPPKSVLKLLDFQTQFLREIGIIPPAREGK